MAKLRIQISALPLLSQCPGAALPTLRAADAPEPPAPRGRRLPDADDQPHDGDAGEE